MRPLILGSAVLSLAMLATPAAAQCAGGICLRPARAVIAAPVRVAGAVVHRVQSRRAMRVNRRVGRRMARRARRGLRGRCCG